MFNASDPQVPDVITSGFSLTNYILTPDSDTVELSTYTGPFNLPEGVRPLYYLSVDHAGNYEFPKATTVYIDATPPATELSGTDLVLSPGGGNYAAISGTVTLSALDPLVNGARSGHYRTFYLVDREFQDCPAIAQYLAGGQSPTGPPGTCENPIYAGPFFLPPGEHAVNYLSFDNVWNAESPKTFHLTVTGGDTVPPGRVRAMGKPLI